MFKHFNENLAVICLSNLYFTSCWAFLLKSYVIWAYLSNKSGFIEKYWNLAKLWTDHDSWPTLGSARDFVHSILRPMTPSFFSDFKKTALMRRRPRPICIAPTVMVLSDFLVPVFLAPMFGRGAVPAPMGLGPQKPQRYWLTGVA